MLTNEDLTEYFPDGRAEVVDLPTAAAWDEYLTEAGKNGVTVLLIEGGSELASSAVNAGVVDFVEFHISPKLLGGRESIPALGGESPLSMDEARKLYRVKSFTCGDDIIINGFLREC